MATIVNEMTDIGLEVVEAIIQIIGNFSVRLPVSAH